MNSQSQDTQRTEGINCRNRSKSHNSLRRPWLWGPRTSNQCNPIWTGRLTPLTTDSWVKNMRLLWRLYSLLQQIPTVGHSMNFSVWLMWISLYITEPNEANILLQISYWLCRWETFKHQSIRPLSDTVPLWSGSSFGAFVYVGNDAETLKKTITVKISVDFFGFRVIQEVGRIYLSNFNFPQNKWLIETNAIAIVNKKVREPHCVIWKWDNAT